MRYFVYIIHSISIDKYYIGITTDVMKRVREHNEGISKKAWTRRASDWSIVHIEEYQNKEEAIKREKQIKKYKGGNSFKSLLSL